MQPYFYSGLHKDMIFSLCHMRLIRYKRTITPTTSGEVVFASPTHTGPSTSTPIRLTSKGRSALNISLSTVTTSTATEERKARRLPRREREKSMLIIFIYTVMFQMFKINAHNLKLSEFIMYKNLIT